MNKRFETINFDKSLEVVPYTLPQIPAGEFVVDDSCFIPMSEAVAQLGANNVATEKIKNYYDFPTGIDDGREIPFSRTKNAKDIAELSTRITEQTKEIADKLESDKLTMQKRKAFEDKLKADSLITDKTSQSPN